jgi:predicted adenylyl cyclase CyaB
MDLNYNIIKKRVVENFLELEEKIKKVSELKETIKKEVFHFSKEPVDYSNLRSIDKFRVLSKNGKYVVKFLKAVNESNGILESSEESFELTDFFSFRDLMQTLGLKIFLQEIITEEIYTYRKEPNLLLKLVNVESLGTFFEVEFICETEHDQEFAKLKIDKVIDDLGLTNSKEEEKLYIELLLEKQGKIVF